MGKFMNDYQKRILKRLKENEKLKKINSGRMCPHCGSTSVDDYPEEERMEGLAMYWLTGFPQATMNFRYSYRCNNCGYEW